MIKTAKLVSGEFIIGKHVDNVLTNVALVAFQSNPTTGEQKINLMPYMHPISSSLAKIITFEKIIYMEDAPKQLQISYLEMIKSIIQQGEEQRQEQSNEGQNAISEGDSEETG